MARWEAALIIAIGLGARSGDRGHGAAAAQPRADGQPPSLRAARPARGDPRRLGAAGAAWPWRCRRGGRCARGRSRRSGSASSGLLHPVAAPAAASARSSTACCRPRSLIPMANGDGPRMAVRDYYDANTWKFLITCGERAIHRELWGPGVTNRGAAVHRANALVLDQLARRPARPRPGLRQRHRRAVPRAPAAGGRRRRVDQPQQVRLADRYPPAPARSRGASGPPSPTSPRCRATYGFDSRSRSSRSCTPIPRRRSSLRPPAPAPRRRARRVNDVRSGDRDDPALDNFRAGWHVESRLSVTEAEALAADAGLTLVASATSRRCSAWVARGTGSSTRSCRCCAAPRRSMWRSRWSAGTPCSTAIAPV